MNPVRAFLIQALTHDVATLPSFGASIVLINSLKEFGVSNSLACIVASNINMKIYKLDDEITETIQLYAKLIFRMYAAMVEKFGTEDESLPDQMLINMSRNMTLEIQ